MLGGKSVSMFDSYTISYLVVVGDANLGPSLFRRFLW